MVQSLMCLISCTLNIVACLMRLASVLLPVFIYNSIRFVVDRPNVSTCRKDRRVDGQACEEGKSLSSVLLTSGTVNSVGVDRKLIINLNFLTANLLSKTNKCLKVFVVSSVW